MSGSAQFLKGMGGKIEKDPIALGFEGEFLQFVPETLEHPFTFSDDQFAPLIPKIGNIIEKNSTFRSILHHSLHF